MSAPAPIRLHLLPDAPDAEGEPRAALLVPPPAYITNRRPVLRMFPTVAAALAVKRSMEAEAPR